MAITTLSWTKVELGKGRFDWIVHADTGDGKKGIAEGATRGEALEKVMGKLGFTIMDRADWPPGKIAHFPTCGDLVRNVAVLRTGLHSLYEEVGRLEANLPQGIHNDQGFDVNGHYAMLSVKFDWFSISMLNLMEGVSLLDTLAHEEGGYVELAARREGMKLIQSRAQEYTKSISEAGPLRQWRNKVAAHRSGISPPPGGADDSMTTRLISLMGAQVMARNGRYVAPAVKPGSVGPDPAASGLQEWSLTKTWESLASRRYEWLNDGSFFKNVSSLIVGGGTRVHSFSMTSGNKAVKEFLKREGIELPRE